MSKGSRARPTDLGKLNANWPLKGATIKQCQQCASKMLTLKPTPHGLETRCGRCGHLIAEAK